MGIIVNKSNSFKVKKLKGSIDNNRKNNNNNNLNNNTDHNNNNKLLLLEKKMNVSKRLKVVYIT